MRIFPVNLLIEGRRCLIVGGGKVAARKMENLLAAGADVTVVAEKVSAKIADAAERGDVELRKRSFEIDDLDGVFLLYAATDDRALNLKIRREAAARRILTCVVDRNWSESDFITPAVLRKGDVTVSVSTHGTACRRARMIKDDLAKHIDAVESTRLIVLGTDHRLLDEKSRARFHLLDAARDEAAERILTLSGVREFLILNTCNRVELIAAVSPSDALMDMLKMIFRFDELDEGQFYRFTDFKAFRHVIFTISGLYAQVPGENHITAQFKEALAAAERKKWCGALTRSLGDSLMHVAKHIRSEVIIPRSRVREIEELTVDRLRSIHGDSLKKKKIMIAGTGKLGTALEELLAPLADSIFWIYNSKKPESPEGGVSVHPLSEAEKLLPETDILISALSSEKPVFTKEMTASMPENALAVDLGAPPNIESGERGVETISLEDMKHLSPSALELETAMREADAIIEAHEDVYEKFAKSFIDGRQG